MFWQNIYVQEQQFHCWKSPGIYLLEKTSMLFFLVFVYHASASPFKDDNEERKFFKVHCIKKLIRITVLFYISWEECICKLPFPFCWQQCINEAAPKPWKQTATLPVHHGISPLPSANYGPARPGPGMWGILTRNVLPKPKTSSGVSSWGQTVSLWYTSQLFCIKWFGEENNLLVICLMTRYVTCQWHLLRK